MNCTELNMRGRRCLARDSKKVITSGWMRLLTSGQPGWFVTVLPEKKGEKKKKFFCHK